MVSLCSMAYLPLFLSGFFCDQQALDILYASVVFGTVLTSANGVCLGHVLRKAKVNGHCRTVIHVESAAIDDRLGYMSYGTVTCTIDRP